MNFAIGHHDRFFTSLPGFRSAFRWPFFDSLPQTWPISFLDLDHRSISESERQPRDRLMALVGKQEIRVEHPQLSEFIRDPKFKKSSTAA